MDTLVEVQSSLTLHQHQASLEKSNATGLKHTSQEEEGQQVESAPPVSERLLAPLQVASKLQPRALDLSKEFRHLFKPLVQSEHQHG